MFLDALHKQTQSPSTDSDIHPANVAAATIYHHLPYHPDDPPSKLIQRHFYQHILQSKNEPHFTSLTNFDGSPVHINCLIIAYHKPKNLRNLLFPQKFPESQQFIILDYLTQYGQSLRN